MSTILDRLLPILPGPAQEPQKGQLHPPRPVPVHQEVHLEDVLVLVPKSIRHPFIRRYEKVLQSKSACLRFVLVVLTILLTPLSESVDRPAKIRLYFTLLHLPKHLPVIQ